MCTKIVTVDMPSVTSIFKWKTTFLRIVLAVVWSILLVFNMKISSAYWLTLQPNIGLRSRSLTKRGKEEGIEQRNWGMRFEGEGIGQKPIVEIANRHRFKKGRQMAGENFRSKLKLLIIDTINTRPYREMDGKSRYWEDSCKK